MSKLKLNLPKEFYCSCAQTALWVFFCPSQSLLWCRTASGTWIRCTQEKWKFWEINPLSSPLHYSLICCITVNVSSKPCFWDESCRNSSMKKGKKEHIKQQVRERRSDSLRLWSAAAGRKFTHETSLDIYLCPPNKKIVYYIKTTSSIIHPLTDCSGCSNNTGAAACVFGMVCVEGFADSQISTTFSTLVLTCWNSLIMAFVFSSCCFM